MNDDGENDIADGISLIQYLFAGGAAPPAPFPTCGSGNSPTSLDCTLSAC